jgi:hypothetical protein
MSSPMHRWRMVLCAFRLYGHLRLLLHSTQGVPSLKCHQSSYAEGRAGGKLGGRHEGKRSFMFVVSVVLFLHGGAAV